MSNTRAVKLLLTLANNSGLDFDESLVTNAVCKGNKIHFIGFDEEEDVWLLCTFTIDEGGKTGDFGGAPDGMFLDKPKALEALKAIAAN